MRSGLKSASFISSLVTCHSHSDMMLPEVASTEGQSTISAVFKGKLHLEGHEHEGQAAIRS